jgi:hypothetical protein
MKKVLIALTVCAFFASCGGGSSSTEAAKDSTSTMSADTSKMAAPAVVDSTKMDSTHTMSADTTKK